MFSVESRLRLREVLARVHMSSAERKDTMCSDISSGREKKKWKQERDDIVTSTEGRGGNVGTKKKRYKRVLMMEKQHTTAPHTRREN